MGKLVQKELHECLSVWQIKHLVTGVSQPLWGAWYSWSWQHLGKPSKEKKMCNIFCIRGGSRLVFFTLFKNMLVLSHSESFIPSEYTKDKEEERHCHKCQRVGDPEAVCHPLNTMKYTPTTKSGLRRPYEESILNQDNPQNCNHDFEFCALCRFRGQRLKLTLSLYAPGLAL